MALMRERTDSELARAIVEELRWVPSVHGEDVVVTANAGTVTLTGDMATYPEVLLAVKAALAVRGVDEVVQNIAVRDSKTVPTDAQITRHAMDALKAEATIPSTVTASVSNSAITLSGEIAAQWQRDSAIRAASYVPGVKKVVDAMTIRIRGGAPAR